MTQQFETDVVIVGAGLVGLSAAVAFAKQGKSVVLVDSKPATHQKTNTWDARIYALTPGTQAWFNALDVWQQMDATRLCSIDLMQIWHENAELLLHSNDAHLATLGVIVENQNLMQALWYQVNALGVNIVAHQACLHIKHTAQQIQLCLEHGAMISAQLLIGADSVNSWVRQAAGIALIQKDFHQTAIVANFSTTKPHQNSARQWFSPHQTLALLPLAGQNLSLVWSVSTQKANALLKLSKDALTQQVEAQLESRGDALAGELMLIGDVFSFKLHSQTAVSMVAKRLVLLGDAAHQIHPMAGQGVNLGFRDVMELTSLATKLNGMQDLGDASFLRQYARARKADTLAMNSLTSGLDALFASDHPVLKPLTNWGLRQLNHQTSIKKLLIQQATA